MRCFIALDMPAEIKEAIGAVVEKVRPAARGIRWVPPHNIHLTLKFLGEIQAEMVPEIQRILSAVCSRRPGDRGFPLPETPQYRMGGDRGFRRAGGAVP